MTYSRKNGPPGQVVAAAVLCGFLSVPLLATAGSLAAHATIEAGIASTASGFLAVGVLATAGTNVAGALRLLQRGTARLATLGGYLTIAVTAVMLAALLSGASAVTVTAVSLGVLTPAVVMLALLGSRRARLWHAAGGRAFRLADVSRQTLRQITEVASPPPASERAIRT